MNRSPIEVALLESVPYSTQSSVSGIPEATGKRLLAASNRVSIEPGNRSIGGRNGASAENGGEPQNSRFSAVMTEEATERLTFSGRVVDSGGEPVADAEVLYSLQSNQPKSVTRTAEDGMFNFEIPRPESEEWDRVDIVAVHPQHASGWQNLRAQSTANVEIQLKKPAIISGRIMNTVGEPVQNAEVQLKDFLRDNLIFLGLDDHSVLNLIPVPPVKSDVNGNFIFRRLPQGRTATLSVQGQGYANERQAAVLTGTEGLEFKLEREAQIEGQLSYEESGAPVESATISVESIRPAAAGGRASVDVNGKYVVRNLPSGTYNVYLQEGPAGWTAAANTVVKVAEGQTASKVDMTLVRAGYVTGRVTNRDTNEPIANYEIRMYDAARPAAQKKSHSMQTDESGTYRFSVAPGPGRIFGSPPPGYQSDEYIDKNVHVVEAETLVVDFQFSKGTPSVFRTLTETGDPVTGARITDSFGGRRDYGKSNEHGELTVHGLRLGQKLVLTAEQSELKLRGSAEVEFQPGASIEIRMKPFKLVKISGRVVNSDGEPIPSARIHRHRRDPLRHTVIVSGVGVTNGDGWFRDVGLIAGVDYVITARAKGYWREVTEEFTATEGMVQFDDFVLRPAIGQFSIEGRIIDTSGNPVNGAQLKSRQQGQYWETFTDENGDYRLGNLPMVVLYYLDII
ncbi:MAG: carboxypeptidase-like regulatory domain-containing protein, partial [Candidatus Poribacteria bacterium]|nr:carboxypeptidase-like regulatory domain-containing protein [Candidatus Poribacteria bacterium]